MANVTLAGFVYNNAGEAVSGATVEAFPRNTTTTATSNTTTNSSGYWSLDVSTEGRYDVRITYGSSIRFIKYDDSAQMTELEVADFHIRNPANTYDYDIVPAAITADRQLNLPLITGSRTLIATDTNIADSENIVFGTGGDATIDFDGDNLVITPAAAGSGDVVITGGSLEVGDAEGTRYGAAQDAELRWSTGDSDNHAFVVGVGASNAAMHIANIGDIATDWNVSAEADPQLFIHCNTNPATEYLRIGNLDATNAEIDLVGGTTIKFQIDGTDEMTLTASAIDMKDNTVDLGDAKGTRYGAGQDAELRWSTADSDNHAFVIGLGASNAALHLANQGDIATDWNVSAEGDPQLFIHCNTNPATEYLRIGNLDATNAEIDLVGGTTINLQIDGTTEASLTASVFNLASGNTYQINGTDVITASALGTGMQADQAAIEGQTNENTYVPPDLMHHHPGVAKAWCFIAAAGTLSSPDYGVASVDDNGTGDRDVNYDTAFSSSVYSAIANNAHGSSNIARNVNVSLTAGDCSIFINDAESNAASDQNNCFVAFGDH